mmetsp:Transcript_58003/g.188742  ORF Transcript_58003/g.188742 Transcript_58003/m.188742 type:complete len:197 (+) Transcript_58003:61-651(+)
MAAARVAEMAEGLDGEVRCGGGLQHLLLLRHGTPMEEKDDPKRPLSEQGQSEAEFTAKGVAAYLSAMLPAGKARLLHSGKDRALQTAEAVERTLAAGGWACVCEQTAGLDPKDPPDVAIALVGSASEEVLVLVGHLPHMGLFAASLVGEPAAAGRLGGCFNPAGGLALRPASAGEAGRWEEAKQIETGVEWWSIEK